MPLEQRDDKSVLPLEDALSHLKGLFMKMKADGVSPKQLLEQSVWIHKVLHEFFFTPEIDDYVMRAYIERHFAVGDVKQSQLDGQESATVYDFCVDKDSLVRHVIAPSDKSNQYLSIVKFRANSENFFETVTHDNLLNSLASKYAESGIKSNGVLCQLRITLLVNVVQESNASAASSNSQQSRNALLEELPDHSKQDNALVSQAEVAAERIRSALSKTLDGFDIFVTVIVCNEENPLQEVDLLGCDNLELWRLPKHAKLESEVDAEKYVFSETRKKRGRFFLRERLNVESVDGLPEAMQNCMRNASEVTRFLRAPYKKVKFCGNHILMYVSFPKMPVDFTRDNVNLLEEYVMESIKNQRDILYKHHVTEVEVIFAKVCSDGRQLIKHRIKFLDETGVTPEFGVYEENKRQITPLRLSHQLYDKNLEAHGKIKKIEKKRVSTRRHETTYAYDFPSLFGRACLDEWKKCYDNVESSNDNDDKAQLDSVFATLTKQQQSAYTSGDYRQFFTEVELVLKDGVLVEVASKEKLKHRADNCNNKTGVVAWKLRLFTPEKPKGYDVVVMANGITYKAEASATQTDKMGQLTREYSRDRKIPVVEIAASDRKTEQVGVENIQSSGLIAGETSAAYNEVLTYCLLTGRSVGIGAYTARLGHRIVQAKNSHLILPETPRTHCLVNDDFEGVRKIVQWMGYLPQKVMHFPFHERFGMDRKLRPVKFTPEPNKPYDIRDLIDSTYSTIFSGICDSNSFDEIGEEWAKTFVAGRARIGGIPIGVVSPELGKAKNVAPADPAAPNSQSIEIHQAGQVWYPDSTSKISEVIGDFNREGLPLLFIAFLPGFSGGQKDMFDMLLKFGAQIVDALRQYKQPVIIYIPVQGELRGGALAVLDRHDDPITLDEVETDSKRNNHELKTTLANCRNMFSIIFSLEWAKVSHATWLLESVTCDVDKAYKLVEQEWEKKVPGILSCSPEDQFWTMMSAYRRPGRPKRALAPTGIIDLTGEGEFDDLTEQMPKKCREETAAQVVTMDATYKWVQDQLEAYNPGFTSLSPSMQSGIVDKFISEGKFREDVDMVHEDSVEREILSMPPDVRERLFQRYLARKNSI